MDNNVDNKIPKIIHYCWFGGQPLPPLAKKCIASWKKYMPEYDIKEWNESNFDISLIPYSQQAYDQKKYAFVSDYARFWILYHYGGVYFDTDVEVIKPLEDIISKGPFMGCENSYDPSKNPISLGVAPGLGLAVAKGNNLYKEILDKYSNLQFICPDGTLNLKTIVEYTSEILYQKGLQNIPDIQKIENIYIYPKDYFCPIDYNTLKKDISENTRTIHHYAGSWQGPKERMFNFIKKIIGFNNTKFLVGLFKG